MDSSSLAATAVPEAKEAAKGQCFHSPWVRLNCQKKLGHALGQEARHSGNTG